MKQFFYVILSALFILYGCKPSNKKQDDSTSFRKASREPAVQDEELTDSIRAIEFDNKGRKYSAKELSKIMDTLNVRIDKSILKHNIQMWAISESENRIEVMLIGGNQEKIATFKSTVMNSPAIIFTEEDSSRPTEEVCNSCGLSMVVAPAVYKLPIKEIEVQMTNTTNKEVITGEYFYLEFYDGSDWKKVPLNYFFNSLGYMIEANEIKTYKVNIQPKAYKYKAGKYRIFKKVSVGKKNYNLVAEFNLK